MWFTTTIHPPLVEVGIFLQENDKIGSLLGEIAHHKLKNSSWMVNWQQLTTVSVDGIMNKVGEA